MAKKIINKLNLDQAVVGKRRSIFGLTAYLENTSPSLIKKTLWVIMLLFIYMIVQAYYLTLQNQLKSAETELSGTRAYYLNLKSNEQKAQRLSVLVDSLSSRGSELKLFNQPPTKIIVNKKR